MLLLLASLLSVAALGHAENLTVTDEVFLDMEIEDEYGQGKPYTGRIVIALFGEVVPITVTNFRSLAKGHKHRDEIYQYKGCPVHRIIRDFVIQTGDVTEGTGDGGTSVYGQSFRDENFELSHRSPGWVSMANAGPNTNKSQFFITLVRARWLDGNHVVFGKVIKGMDVVHHISEVPIGKKSGMALKKVTIADSGVLPLKQRYQLNDEQLSSPNDLF